MTQLQDSDASGEGGPARALAACRGAFAWAGFFSLFVNLLMLTPALYMLQVYDRVLVGGSESTLFVLTLLVVFLFIVLGGLEWVRAQVLVVAGDRIDHRLCEPLFDALFARTLANDARASSAQPLADLQAVRQFVTGPGLTALLDAPWLPVYVAVLFAFHSLLGAGALLAVAVLLGFAIANERLTRKALADAGATAVESANGMQRNLRNAEVIAAMGMLSRIRERWRTLHVRQLARQSAASRTGGLFGAFSRTFRLCVQSLVLGLGAWLALERELTPGGVIAASILLGRALAPIDQLIGSWRTLASAREAWLRIRATLAAASLPRHPMPLPAPRGEIDVQGVDVVPAGSGRAVLKNISFQVPPGCTVAIAGPSGAGKTTLVRTLLGIVAPTAGSVRIDGAERAQWHPEVFGQHVGYVPQDVELLDGSVAENIARFGDVDADRVVAAARSAGVHDVVLRLPSGYETLIGGHLLSAGQRQQIALARAIYGSPRIVVLDEPHSNLDQAGEAALEVVLRHLRDVGSTVLLISHRPHVLARADRILLLVDGAVSAYGRREAVLATLRETAARAQAAAPGRTAAVVVQQAETGPGLRVIPKSTRTDGEGA